jgi:hypothetical protein
MMKQLLFMKISEIRNELLIRLTTLFARYNQN